MQKSRLEIESLQSGTKIARLNYMSMFQKLTVAISNKMMNFVSEMMDFVVQMMDFVLKMRTLITEISKESFQLPVTHSFTRSQIAMTGKPALLIYQSPACFADPLAMTVMSRKLKRPLRHKLLRRWQAGFQWKSGFSIELS